MTSRVITAKRLCLVRYAVLLLICFRKLCRESVRAQSFLQDVAPKRFYKVWKCTSTVTAELFANCFNESGVLARYCSKDGLDVELGFLGTWKCCEDSLFGRGGKPPLIPLSFIVFSQRRRLVSRNPSPIVGACSHRQGVGAMYRCTDTPSHSKECS